MRLFIAEKPSLAKAIFEGLGGNPNTEKKNGYFQHGDDAVVPCTGHMFETNDPEDYDPKYAKWIFADLPIPTTFPPVFKIKPDTAAQTRIILSLLEQADSIVHAGDPDEEGCLLVDEILDYAGNKKPVQRLLVVDLNLAPMQKALANLQPNENFRGMTDSALSRALADKAFGYNATRGCTLKGREKGYSGVLNVGRVQSAVLGMVNARTLANQNHTETFYYDVHAMLAMSGHTVKAKYLPVDTDQLDDKKRLASEAQARHITEQVAGKEAVVTVATTKPENTAAPLPLDLSTLQIICAQTYGYDADKTLKILQGLYETHKLVSYPRTNCRYLSDEHWYQTGDIADAVSGTMPEMAEAAGAADKNQKHKAFNPKKLEGEAHHALLPTARNGADISLTEDERNVYRLVAISWLALFYPDAIREKTKVHFDVKGYTFTATQSVTLQQGWQALGKGLEAEDDAADAEDPADTAPAGFDLSTLKFSEKGQCQTASVAKTPTKPPKYFTESTLIAAMKNAAKFVSDPVLRKALSEKEGGGTLGTEATRAGILKKMAENTGLFSIAKEKGYKEKVWKTTQQGQEFCAALPAEVTQPDISARWAEKQALIRAGKMTVADFVRENDDYISGLIGNLSQNGINLTVTGTSCPACTKGILVKRNSSKGPFWSCSCYPECKTSYPDDDGKPATDRKPGTTGLTRLKAPCPMCGKPVVAAAKSYACTGCQFRLPVEICAVTLPVSHVETLLSTGRTPEIKGFYSKQKGKSFDACLALDATGKTGFVFPPSKKK